MDGRPWTPLLRIGSADNTASDPLQSGPLGEQLFRVRK